MLDSDPAHAILFGLALGDALGWPVEFMELPQIRAKYGRAGITAPPDPALYTDDTQMSLAVAEALVEAGETPNDLNRLMGAMGRHFIGWKRDPTTPSRAPGATSMRGVNALERGAPWREAGVRDSKGCGSCMRVAPIGYFYQHDPESLREVARAQGWLTHRHPTADAASIGAAYLIKLALDNVPVKDYPESVLAFTTGISGEFDAAIGRVTEALDWSDEESALNHIGPTRGGGWIAEEAVAMALYCVLKHPDDYVSVVRLGANISGDSDSVAAIAGGIAGARLGLSALPEDWIARLENRDYLAALADRLAEKKP
jgi:ADP-ribosylglycohydrolase